MKRNRDQHAAIDDSLHDIRDDGSLEHDGEHFSRASVKWRNNYELYSTPLYNRLRIDYTSTDTRDKKG